MPGADQTESLRLKTNGACPVAQVVYANTHAWICFSLIFFKVSLVSLVQSIPGEVVTRVFGEERRRKKNTNSDFYFSRKH